MSQVDPGAVEFCRLSASNSKSIKVLAYHFTTPPMLRDTIRLL